MEESITNTFTDSDEYTHCNPNGYTVTNAYSDTDDHTYGVPNSNADGYSDADTNAGTDSDS